MNLSALFDAAELAAMIEERFVVRREHSAEATA